MTTTITAETRNRKVYWPEATDASKARELEDRQRYNAIPERASAYSPRNEARHNRNLEYLERGDRDALFHDSQPLAFWVIKPYLQRRRSDFDELKQIALIALWRASQEWTLEFNCSFTTFAVNGMRWAISAAFKKDFRQRRPFHSAKEFSYSVVEDAVTTQDHSPPEEMIEDETKVEIDERLERLRQALKEMRSHQQDVLMRYARGFVELRFNKDGTFYRHSPTAAVLWRLEQLRARFFNVPAEREPSWLVEHQAAQERTPEESIQAIENLIARATVLPKAESAAA